MIKVDLTYLASMNSMSFTPHVLNALMFALQDEPKIEMFDASERLR